MAANRPGRSPGIGWLGRAADRGEAMREPRRQYAVEQQADGNELCMASTPKLGEYAHVLALGSNVVSRRGCEFFESILTL